MANDESEDYDKLVLSEKIMNINCIKTISMPSRGIMHCLIISEDNTMLLASFNNSIYLFSLPNLTFIQENKLPNEVEQISFIIQVSDNQYITTSHLGFIHKWFFPSPNGNYIIENQIYDGGLNKVIKLFDSLMATGTVEGDVILFESDNLNMLHIVKCHLSPTISMLYSLETSEIISCPLEKAREIEYQGVVYKFDYHLRDGLRYHYIENNHLIEKNIFIPQVGCLNPNSMMFYENTKILIGSVDKIIIVSYKLFQIDTIISVPEITCVNCFIEGINGFFFCGGGEGHILWRIPSLQNYFYVINSLGIITFKVEKPHDGNVSACVMLDDMNFITSSVDGKIKIWKIYNF